ncbi:MAG: zinc ABC transporter substrate-binding protein, partial [Saprospiraceae bacterium]
LLLNGLTFEGWINSLIKAANTDAKVYTITQGVKPIQSDQYHNASDPHAWMSASNGLIYIQNIKDALIENDPSNKTYYLNNYRKYRQKITALDAYIQEEINKIPKEKKMLVTSHDAFAYYGKRYKIKLNALKGISTEAETQTADMVRVAEAIKATGVPAIFIESTINPKVIQQIATDNDVAIGGELFADSIGDEDSDAHSYYDMLKHNTDVIVSALSRGKITTTKIDTDDTTANYKLLGLVALLMAGGLFFLITKFDKSYAKVDIGNISVKGLSVSYERKRVLTNIFLEIKKGSLYGVVGPNGAGKSTLFKSILGLIDINSGSITIDDKSIEDVRKQVAYVPQRDDVDWTFPTTVLDVVLMGRYPHKKIMQRINKNDKTIAIHALEEIGIANLADRQIGQLSGGQQQRVFIARALCQQADIFFLDEPFVGVDILTEEKIISILKKLAKDGKTVLVVHHDLSTIEDYFDKVILLNQRLIAYGDTKKTFTKENMAKCYGPQLTILNKTGGLTHAD